MCVDPATVALIATVASSAIGAYSSVQQGRAQYQADMYAAEVSKQNAQALEDDKALTKDQAAIERRRLGERVRGAKGEQIAKATAMGTDPAFGSSADLIGDIEQSYKIDRSILGRNEITDLQNIDNQQADYLDGANRSRASASGALRAGYMGAAGSLLEGASAVSGKWIKPPVSPVSGGSKVGGYGGRSMAKGNAPLKIGG